jgi:pSer/pThr/pTyr-binding forkhead associated (FHA) protein
MRPGVASATAGRTWVRERRELGLAQRPFPWLAAGGAFLAAAIAGGLVATRYLPLGRVRLTTSGEVLKVTHAGLTIGGAVGNNLVVADPRVSRSHAVIRSEKGRVMLVDLRSANGTKVNGRAVSSVALQDGDRIRLADAIELVWEEGFRFGKGR